MKVRSLFLIIGSILFLSGTVYGQLVAPNAFLQGHWVEVGVAANGSWGGGPSPAGYHAAPSYGGAIPTAGGNLAMVYDYGHDGWAVGTPPYFGDYTYPGTPFEGWSMQANGARSDAFYTSPPGAAGASFNNAIAGTSALSGSNTGYSNIGGIISGVWQGSTTGTSGGLSIRQTTRIDTNASWVVVTTVFTNTSGTAIPGVYYWRTCDPDDDVTHSGNYATNNSITYQNDVDHRVLVGSYGTSYSNAYLALGTKDCRAKSMIYTTWATYPTLTGDNLDQIYAGTATGLGTTYYGIQNVTIDQDIAIGLIYNLGTIGAGDSTLISYAYIFNDSTGIDSAFPEPVLIVNGGRVPATGPAPAPTIDTFKPCNFGLSVVPVSIGNANDKDWSWSTWTWSPGTGLSSTTGVNNTINVTALSGPTTYTITGTDSAVDMFSCNHRVMYLTIIPCFSATNNGPLCQGDTLKLIAQGDSTGATYVWYGPGTGGPVVGTTQDVTIPNAPFSDSGTYYVIKTVGTAHDTANTRVVINRLPVVVATSNAPICSGSTLTLFANPDSTGETFTWTGPNTFSSATQNPTISNTPVMDSGTYKVVTALNGCKDSSTVHVVIDSTPALPVAASNSPVCSGNTLLLTATDVTPGVSYTWTGPAGYYSGLQDPGITGVPVTASGIYTVTVTLAICHSSDTTTVVINPTPPAPSLTSNSIVCSGNSLLLTATTTAGSTYSWNGPNSFSSGLQNPTINPATTAATGTYTVIATLNGCPSQPALIDVAVDSTPLVPMIGSNSPVCSGNTLQLTSSDSTTGVGFNWVGPIGFTSILQSPSITPVSTAASGTYTVTASLGVCHSSATTVVVVNLTPPPPVLSSNAPICSGNPLNFTAVDSTGSAYNWIGPYGFVSTLQNPTISPATTQATGFYTATATINGCTSAVATIFVVVDSTPGTPVVSSNSPGAPSICQGDTLKLMATDTTIGVNYFWVGPDSFTSFIQNPFIAPATPAADGSYTVTISQGSCTAAAVTVVSITPTPPLVATSNSPVCTGLNDTLYLYARGDSGATYTWSGPHVFISLAQNNFRTPVLLDYGGIYRVTVLFDGCTNTANDTVVVNETPAPPWNTWLTYCHGYDDPPLQSYGSNILWYTSSLPGAIGISVAPVPPTDADTVMWFYTTQTVQGCTSAIDSTKVTVLPRPLVTVSAPVGVCPHDSATLTAVDTDPIAYYHWAPRMYLSDTAGATVITYPETDITYSVVATNQYGCTDTATVHISVHPAGVIYLGDSVTLYTGDSYQISPQTNCYTFLWIPTSGLSNAYISDPIASPLVSTRYIVYGTTAWGCKAADSIEINVNLGTLITVPNAFTPGSGSNNEFKIIKLGIATLNYFRIFDRWGNKVFETNNIDQGWDGTYRGTPQPEGVFIYEIGATTGSGQNFEKHGNVTLLR